MPDAPVSRTRKIVLAIVVLGIPLLVGAAGVYRSQYHAWPGQSLADRIHWCGRDYEVGTRDVARTDTGLRPGHMTLVMRSPPLPPRHAVYAAGSQAELDARKAKTGICGFDVFAQTGADSFRRYGLSGGP